MPSDREHGIDVVCGEYSGDEVHPEAAGSGDMPAPAPVPVPPVPRSVADCVVVCPNGGVIRYYARYNRFQAQCNSPYHGSCKLTRTSERSSTLPAQGKPVGLMAAWLHNEMLTLCHDHESHISVFALGTLTHDKRLRARQALLDLPNGNALVSYEREPNDGDVGGEPLDIP